MEKEKFKIYEKDNLYKLVKIVSKVEGEIYPVEKINFGDITEKEREELMNQSREILRNGQALEIGKIVYFGKFSFISEEESKRIRDLGGNWNA